MLLRIVFFCILIQIGSVSCKSKEEDKLTGAEFAALVGLLGSYGQTNQDADTAWGIVAAAGKFRTDLILTYGASQNVTDTCPGGGQVTVTGSFTKPSADTLVNLQYQFQSCKILLDANVPSFVRSGLTLTSDYTITGTMTESGSYNSSTTNLNYTATNLTVVGAQTNTGYVLGSPATISNSNCEITIHRPAKGLNGTICTRSFAY